MDSGEISTAEQAEAAFNAEYHGRMAEMGLVDSQFLLAQCYEFGKGVPRNFEEAARWYRKASEQGHRDAYIASGRLQKVKEETEKRQASRTQAAQAPPPSPPRPRTEGEAKNNIQKFQRILDQELSSLVGLRDVRKQLLALMSMIAYNGLRADHGLPYTPINANMVLTGNPGTGKTTVARIVSNILSAAGILNRGHLVEVSVNRLCQSSLVGTEILGIKKAISDAYGGVLFIDEAHSLPNHTSKTAEFWRNIVTELLQAMTQKDAHRTVVIFAGYEEGIQNLFDLEPGLKSRFQIFMHFKDYATEELSAIFEKMAFDGGYTLAAGCNGALHLAMKEAPHKYAKNFGNARYSKNLFDETIRQQAQRVLSSPSVTKEDLMTLTPFDINAAHEENLKLPL
jgi:SpoVK/Ycf46/Vps4 family AAA+-type ATPase